MYKNKEPHYISGVLYDVGEHTITQPEYDSLTPEGKAVYVKANDAKTVTKSKADDKI